MGRKHWAQRYRETTSRSLQPVRTTRPHLYTPTCRPTHLHTPHAHAPTCTPTHAHAPIAHPPTCTHTHLHTHPCTRPHLHTQPCTATHAHAPTCTQCAAAVLSRVGKVESLKLLPKRHCAFVNYVSALDAARAIDTLQVIHRSHDCHMLVTWACDDCQMIVT